MLKQNRLFSSVYIVGTGLSIALVMVLFVIYYVKAGPVYPEYNRDRMLVIKTMKSQDKGSNGTSCNTGVSYFVAKTLLKDLPHLDQIAVFQGGGWSKMRVDLPGNQGSQEILPGYVDCGFWSMFPSAFSRESLLYRLMWIPVFPWLSSPRVWPGNCLPRPMRQGSI